MRLPPFFVSLVLSAGFLFTAVSCGGGTRPVPVAEQPTKARNAEGQYISWREHRIDDEELSGGVPLRGADGLLMADFDQDGHEDIVSVHEDSSHIRIAFGSDDPHEWFRLTLAEGAEAGAAEDVSAGDLNRDGFPDLIAACEQAHLLYLQNPGGKVRGFRWERVVPKAAQGRGSFIRAFFADLDGDGRPEVTAANKGEHLPEETGKSPLRPISWFEAPRDPLRAEGWTEHVLAEVRIPINAEPVDLDGDGSLDVLGGSRGESRVIWFENRGGEPLDFAAHAIEIQDMPEGPGLFGGERITGFNNAFYDVNGDGRLDIITPDFPSALVWLEQPEDPSQPWTYHRIGGIAPDHLVGVALADITGDGRPDVMAGGYSRGPRDEDGEDVGVNDAAGRIAWFENPGEPSAEWPRHDVSRRKRGMYDAFIPRDMDGDGDIDFVATRGNSGEYDGVFWLEQLHSEEPARAFQPARERESEHLPLPAGP